jgi:Predicted nucleotide-binding protein containing TIR-like domain
MEPPFGVALAATGLEQNLPPVGQSTVICVHVQRQQISLEVDGVPVLQHGLRAPLPHGQLGLFTWGEAGGVEFTQLSARPDAAVSATEIFIVHGHDDHAKMEVAHLIERAGLTAVILHEQPNDH